MPAFTSAFTTVLRTNHVPSSLDRQHIKDILVEPRNRLLGLNNKISDLERTLDDLRRERNGLDDEIEEHARLLTPFRRLPDDMLREIFLACLPDQHNAIMSLQEAPLVLSLVCHRWRSLVYSTPNLWSSLHIPYPVPASIPYGIFGSEELQLDADASADRLRKHYVAVQEWLARSGACPLSISFFCIHIESVTRYNDILTSAVEAYLDIMISFSHRWHSLDLYIPPGLLFNCIASLPTTSIPNLKHLQLSFSRSMSAQQGAEWATSGLLNVPQLQQLCINFQPFRMSLLANCWTDLTFLDLGNGITFSPNATRNVATIEEAYFIFSKCRRLVHCSLEVFDRSDATSPPGIIPIPRLKSLSIVESCQNISTLFECFTDLASFHGISYHSKLRPSNHRKSPLITLLARTNNQLDFLSTDISYYTLADLITVLKLVPNLTHLIDNSSSREESRRDFLLPSRVRNSSLPDSFNFHRAFLDLLSPHSNGEVYCPRLRILRLSKTCRIRDCEIVTFLQRRMDASKHPNGHVEPLRQFCASLVFRGGDMDIPAQLSEFPSLKLDITRPTNGQIASLRQRINPEIGLLRRPMSPIIQACHSS